MAALLTTVCFLFMAMEAFVGMVANGSIVLINLIGCFRRWKLSPTDLILTCLGASRLLLLAVMNVDLTLLVWFDRTLHRILLTIMGVWIFTNAVNLWLAACLSVFYLAKIAIFSHPVFLQVKQWFSKLLPWLLLSSVAFSAAVAIIVTPIWMNGLFICYSLKSSSSNRSNAQTNMPHVCSLQVKQWFSKLLPWLLLSSVAFSAAVAIIVTPIWMNGLFICYSLKSSSSNRSNAQTNMPHVCSRNLALVVGVDFIPFVVFLSSSIFLISSLWKHVRRVQCDGTGSKDVNTQAHWSAIRALASFAVLHLISYAAFTSLTVLILDDKYTWIIVLYNVSAWYPSGHSVILILINPKLKQAWVRMLRNLKCGSRL